MRKWFGTGVKPEAEMIQVTRQEYELFLASWPRHLETHGVSFCTPPVLEHHDCTLGKPSKSRIAYMVENEWSQGWDGSPNEYYVLAPVKGFHA